MNARMISGISGNGIWSCKLMFRKLVDPDRDVYAFLVNGISDSLSRNFNLFFVLS